MIKMQLTPEAKIAAQRQVTAGASRQEKVDDNSGQATERLVVGRRAGLQTCATGQYPG